MSFKVGEWDVALFATRHGNPERIGETFGFVFDNGDTRIVYTSDYCEILNPDDSILFNANLMIVDSTWLRNQGEEYETSCGHTSFERGLDVYYKLYKPQKIILTHISPNEGLTSVEWRQAINAIAGSSSGIEKIYLSFDGLRLKV
jgi:ribonuclease BN (tRNA processing enzyme)